MRTLVAGVGNVFQCDDGFGSAVAAALAGAELPAGVEVHDFGIRGVHLAYQLLEPYDLVLIADAVARGGAPGTLYVIEHGTDGRRPDPPADAPMMDAHDMTPDEVLALVPRLGGTLGRVLVVGCEPESVDPGMGLSQPVARSVTGAARLVLEIASTGCVPAGARTHDVRIGGRR